MDLICKIVRFLTENVSGDPFREAVMLEATVAIAILAVASPIAQTMASNLSNRFTSELIGARLSKKMNVNVINLISIGLIVVCFGQLVVCTNFKRLAVIVFLVSLGLFTLLLFHAWVLLKKALRYQSTPVKLLDDEIGQLRNKLEEYISKPTQ